MIEGLLLAPWFQDAARRNPASVGSRTNCEKCMQGTSRIARQGMGCGFEPPPPSTVSVMPWQPPQSSKGFRHARPTVCAGYTTNLPEVNQTAKALAHAEHGALNAFCGGEPTPEMLDAILILKAASSDVQVWRMTPSKDGGGAG